MNSLREKRRKMKKFELNIVLKSKEEFRDEDEIPETQEQWMEYFKCVYDFVFDDSFDIRLVSVVAKEIK